jgi:hypothetical protein
MVKDLLEVYPGLVWLKKEHGHNKEALKKAATAAMFNANLTDLDKPTHYTAINIAYSYCVNKRESLEYVVEMVQNDKIALNAIKAFINAI